MCTLTWFHDESGYRLWFNRDELLTRGKELPPAVVDTGRVRYIAPSDSDEGGTWIAVNEHGVTIALLNAYRASEGEPRERYTSRGRLVRELAAVRRPAELWQELSPKRLAEFRPCVVVFVAPEQRSIVARWNGLDLTLDARGDLQLPICSSSFAQDDVQRARKALYRALVEDAGGPDAARLEAFQRFVGPNGPDAYSPSMRRSDAATRSQCRVVVGPREVRITHVPGAPHETPPSPPVTLARRRRT